MESRAGRLYFTVMCTLILETPERACSDLRRLNDMGRVLIVDDEPTIALGVPDARLREEGFGTERRLERAEARFRLAGEKTPDVIVLDVRLPGDGRPDRREEFPGDRSSGAHRHDHGVRQLRRRRPGGRVEGVDYLPKPFDSRSGAARRQAGLRRLAAVGDRPGGGGPPPTETLIGRSHAMQKVFKQIALVADSDVPVLVTGESGTGKELVAQAIHRCSRRRDRPVVPVCVAAFQLDGPREAMLFGHVKGAFTAADRERTGVLDLAEGGRCSSTKSRHPAAAASETAPGDRAPRG